MPSKFGGTPVGGGSKFGGVAVGASAAPKPESRGYWKDRMSEAQAMGDGVRYSVANTALGAGQLLGAAGESDVQNFRAKRDAARAGYEGESQRGGAFFGGGEYVGDAAQAALPLGAAGQGIKAANYARAGISGGLFGASRPVMGGESRIANTAIGAGSNAGGVALGHAVGALGKVASKGARDVFNAAQDRGIPLTFAQMSDSPFVKRLAHMSDRLPLSGVTSRTNKQVVAVNKSLAKEVGAKVNEDGVIDAGVMAERYERFGPQFDAVFKNGTAIDRDFMVGVGSVAQRANEYMDDTAKGAVKTIVKRLKEQGAAGQISGTTLQSMDRQLRMMATGGGDRQQVAQELRELLHDNFGRNVGAAGRKAWDGVRKQYANYKTIEPLVAANTDGPIPPAQLNRVLSNTKAGKAAMARGGRGAMGELAAIGKRMRGPTTSGTAENAQTAAVGYGLAANPVSTLGLLLSGNTVGRALNSNALARLMMSEGRGKVASLAPYARPLPFLLSGSAYADGPERP